EPPGRSQGRRTVRISGVCDFFSRPDNFLLVHHCETGLCLVLGCANRYLSFSLAEGVALETTGPHSSHFVIAHPRVLSHRAGNQTAAVDLACLRIDRGMRGIDRL